MNALPQQNIDDAYPQLRVLPSPELIVPDENIINFILNECRKISGANDILNGSEVENKAKLIQELIIESRTARREQRIPKFPSRELSYDLCNLIIKSDLGNIPGYSSIIEEIRSIYNTIRSVLES